MILDDDLFEKLKGKRQEFDDQSSLKLDFQRQRLNQYTKVAIDNAKSWEFAQQYYQFFNTLEITSKLNQLPNKSVHQKQLLQSNEHFNVKMMFMNKSMISKIIEILQTKLSLNGFEIIVDQTYHVNQNQNQTQIPKSIGIQISVINNTDNYEITELYCKYGRYAKRYTILNIFETSFRHCLPMLGIGGMGEVYLKKCFQQNFCAIKCTKANNQSESHLKKSIRQFFITDLLSSLEIAPKIIRNTQFDFIIFDKCLQFQLQKCESFKASSIQSDLKEDLLFMHLLKIVHNDIKPSNIMYSPSFKKNVFIDFGISDHLNQSLGVKTWTKFKGTYEFCSEQMQYIVCSKKSEQIDLYKNDVIMLMKSLPTMKFISNIHLTDKIYKKPLEEQYMETIQSQSNVFYFEKITKVHLYKNKSKIKLDSALSYIFQKVQQLKDQDIIINYVKQIFQFTLNFKLDLIFLLLDQKIFKKYEHFLSLQQLPQLNKHDSCSRRDSIKPTYLERIKQQRVQSLRNLKQKNENIQMSFLEVQSMKMFSNNQNKMKIENIQFILFHKKQANQLKREHYFELFLNYSSIWPRNYEEVAMSNRLIASVVLKQIAIQDQSQEKFQFLKEAYFPDDPYIRSNYKDLVWAYGYLLTYCFTGQTNQFKAKYILSIVKETILLNFKYCLFLDRAFLLYIKYLINKKIPNIFSLIQIQKWDFIWLTKVHYSYIVLPKQSLVNIQVQILQNPQNLTKFCLYQVSKIIKKYKTINNQLNNDYKFIQKSLLAICTQLELEQSKLYQKYQLFIEQIDNQIAQLQNIGHFEIDERYYQYLLTIMNYYFTKYKRIDITANKERKFKTKLLKIYKSLNEEQQNFPQSLFQRFTKADMANNEAILEKFLANLDSKIGCCEISKYFFIDLRLQLSMLTKNKLQFTKLIWIISTKSTYLYLNIQFMDDLNLPRFQIKNTLDNESVLSEEQIRSKYCFIIEKISSSKDLNQLIQQKYQQFFFDWINFFVLILYSSIIVQDIKHIISNSSRIIKTFKDFELNLSSSCISKVKSFLRQKLNQPIQKLIDQKLNKASSIPQLMLVYKILPLKLTYNPQQKLQITNTDYIHTQKQIFQCLYLICKDLPLQTKQQSIFKKPQTLLNNKKIIMQPLLMQIILRHTNFIYYFNNQIKIGWENYKLRIFLFNQNQFIQNSFQAIHQVLTWLNLYDVLSQIILVQAYVLWNNKSGMLLNIFNYQVKQLQFTKEREITFCTELINKITKLTNNNFDQTYLFTIFIHVLHYRRYLSQNRAVWKKILYFVCKNFQKFPNLSNQDKNMKVKRKEQIMLRSLIFHQKETKYRKKMIMTRKWVKILQDQSPFQRNLSSDYLLFYLKQHQNSLENHFIQRMYKKRQKIIYYSVFSETLLFKQRQNQQLLQQLSSSSDKSSYFSFKQTKQLFQYLSLSSIKIYASNYGLNLEQKQKITASVQIQLKFVERYNLVCLQLFLYQKYQFINTFKYLQKLQTKIQCIDTQIQNCKIKNQTLWGKKVKELERLKKQHFQRESQLKQNISFIKKTEYYKAFKQIVKIQLKILHQERKRIIRELARSNKLQLNKKQGKYETIQCYGCIEVQFSQSDSNDQ